MSCLNVSRDVLGMQWDFVTSLSLVEQVVFVVVAVEVQILPFFLGMVSAQVWKA